MGHIGLTPQTATALGGYRAQGKTAEAAVQVLDDAKRLEDAGCFAIVIECVPAAVSELICERLGVPTIGIGAGPSTSGQVLVYHDLLGLRDGQDPKFVRRYANLRGAAVDAVASYADDVRSGAYPGPEHVYAIDPSELAAMREELGSSGPA
jgi:3-methyl-2-oxobutanoate hydroxymethyltransferase